MRTLNRSKNKGFTLIELMIVVAIVGILAVLAVVGVRRYLANAKSAEARNALGAIGKGAAQGFEREATTSATLAAGSTATLSRRLCRDASSSVPAAVASIRGQKYQSSNAPGVDWHLDDAQVHKGFACIRYEMTNPQSYTYAYFSGSDLASTPGTSITARAIGDLNGDGVNSKFELLGQVQAQTLTLAPSLVEENPDE